jgi:hypothetical protein
MIWSSNLHETKGVLMSTTRNKTLPFTRLKFFWIRRGVNSVGALPIAGLASVFGANYDLSYFSAATWNER